MNETILSAERAAFDAAYASLSSSDFEEVSIAISRALAAYREALPTVHVVFDSFPSPTGPRFIEVENSDGFSINWGEWETRDDGLVALVFPK